MTILPHFYTVKCKSCGIEIVLKEDVYDEKYLQCPNPDCDEFLLNPFWSGKEKKAGYIG